MYEAIESSEHGYAPQSQHTRFLFTDNLINPGPDTVGTFVQTVRDWTNSLDEVQYLAPAMFNAHQNFLENSQLYSLGEEELGDWTELIMCIFEQGIVPLIFQEMSLSITGVLRTRRCQAPTKEVVEIDDKRNVVTRPVEVFPNFTTLQEMIGPESISFLLRSSSTISASMAR